MALDKQLIRQVRDLDEYDLRRLQIFVRGLLVSREGLEYRGEDRQAKGKITYR